MAAETAPKRRRPGTDVERPSTSTALDEDAHAEMSIKLDMEEIEALATDVTAEELREFLAADGLDVLFDPGFKERLREQLWALVSNRFSSGQR